MQKITISTLHDMKTSCERITMVTAYDATFARLAEAAGVEILLVGDSLGMVIQGEETTLPVTLNDIIYHTKAVKRGTQCVHIVADMPFGTYQGDKNVALENAVRLLKEGGAAAVKLEGGAKYVDVVEHLVRAGIPVMGHIGLTPQHVHALSGFKVQGRSDEAANLIEHDARALQQAGVYAMVLECIPTDLAQKITESLKVPTIGIGAGKYCDGQVLVIYDLLGMSDSDKPKFVKSYLNLASDIKNAITLFKQEVCDGSFPNDEHSYGSKKKKTLQADDDFLAHLKDVRAAVETFPEWQKEAFKRMSEKRLDDDYDDFF